VLIEELQAKDRSGPAAPGQHDFAAMGAHEIAREWTLVVSSADGHACVLAAGTDWQSHSPAVPPALSVLHANSR
jgi:hypothetical protein